MIVDGVGRRAARVRKHGTITNERRPGQDCVWRTREYTIYICQRRKRRFSELWYPRELLLRCNFFSIPFDTSFINSSQSICYWGKRKIGRIRNHACLCFLESGNKRRNTSFSPQFCPPCIIPLDSLLMFVCYEHLSWEIFTDIYATHRYSYIYRGHIIDSCSCTCRSRFAKNWHEFHSLN